MTFQDVHGCASSDCMSAHCVACQVSPGDWVARCTGTSGSPSQVSNRTWCGCYHTNQMAHAAACHLMEMVKKHMYAERHSPTGCGSSLTH
jgi:hypothetical protein